MVREQAGRHLHARPFVVLGVALASHCLCLVLPLPLPLTFLLPSECALHPSLPLHLPRAALNLYLMPEGTKFSQAAAQLAMAAGARHRGRGRGASPACCYLYLISSS